MILSICNILKSSCSQINTICRRILVEICVVPATHLGRVTHICVGKSSFVQINTCRLLGANPLSEPISVEHETKHKLSLTKLSFKMLSAEWRPFFLEISALTD